MYSLLVCLQSPDTVTRFKTVGNNVVLYVGLIGYTAIGAKVLHFLISSNISL